MDGPMPHERRINCREGDMPTPTSQTEALKHQFEGLPRMDISIANIVKLLLERENINQISQTRRITKHHSRGLPGMGTMQW